MSSSISSSFAVFFAGDLLFFGAPLCFEIYYAGFDSDLGAFILANSEIMLKGSFS